MSMRFSVLFKRQNEWGMNNFALDEQTQKGQLKFKQLALMSPQLNPN